MSQASQYDAVYLSPHLDDVPFSCGGQIHRRASRGERILVLTLFAGDLTPEPSSDCARQIIFYMGLPAAEVMAARRREDREACRELGAECEQWRLTECIGRRSPSTGVAFYSSLQQIFGPPAAEEETSLVEELAAKLRSLPAASLVAPLAVGGHVDHRLVRRAAEEAFGSSLGYYEDFPYVRKFRALGKVLGKRSRWRRQVIALDGADLEAKIRSMAAYPSQVKPIFGDDAGMEKAVRRYCRKVGGERLWYRVPAHWRKKRA